MHRIKVTRISTPEAVTYQIWKRTFLFFWKLDDTITISREHVPRQPESIYGPSPCPSPDPPQKGDPK